MKNSREIKEHRINKSNREQKLPKISKKSIHSSSNDLKAISSDKKIVSSKDVMPKLKNQPPIFKYGKNKKFHTETSAPTQFSPKSKSKYSQQIIEGHTLDDFHKLIEVNRNKIKKQKQQSQNDSRKKSRSIHSVLQQPLRKMSAVEKPQKKKKLTIHNEDEMLFSNLQTILQQKITTSKKSRNNNTFDENSVKTLIEKMKRIKNHSSHYLNQQDKKKQEFKHQDNYQQWRKIDINKNSKICYKRSSFQQEMNKVNNFTEQTSNSLEKYVQNRKKLMSIQLFIKP